MSKAILSRMAVTNCLAIGGLCLLTIALGCGRSGLDGETLTGTLSCDGKPVYPAVILLKSAEGKGYSGNVNKDGEFRVFGLSESKYAIAVEPIKLPGMGRPSQAPAIDTVNKELDENGKPRVRREDTRPPEFKNATVKFAKKYSSFETSGLGIDCTDGVPKEPLELILE